MVRRRRRPALRHRSARVQNFYLVDEMIESWTKTTMG
jgi:hypothetical protein